MIRWGPWGGWNPLLGRNDPQCGNFATAFATAATHAARRSQMLLHIGEGVLYGIGEPYERRSLQH